MSLLRKQHPSPIKPFASTPTVLARVKKQYPHSITSFTQGLVMAPNGESYYESIGLYGRSELQEVSLSTGKVLRRRMLPTTQFAEGVTLLPSGQLVQLTWRERVIHIYPSAFTNGPTTSFTWTREGWGITTLRGQLIISDGTSSLYFVQSTAPYRVQRILTVKTWLNGRLQPVPLLNELEMVGDELYANIWKERKIAVIDLVTGIVKKWIDLNFLPLPANNPEAVLNGIAYHQPSNRLFVTGKLWSLLYEIEIP